MEDIAEAIAGITETLFDQNLPAFAASWQMRRAVERGLEIISEASRSGPQDRSRIETHIKPLLGRRQVRALKLADIAGMQADIAAGNNAKPRGTWLGGRTTGGAGVAARTVTTLQSLLAHAKRLDVVASNPALGVRKLAGKKKVRRLSVAEIKKLGETMLAAERGQWERPVAIDAVRLMLLTEFRISEAQGLQRDWLHPNQGYVLFPDTKSDG